jgi:hypothetical protein
MHQHGTHVIQQWNTFQTLSFHLNFIFILLLAARLNEITERDICDHPRLDKSKRGLLLSSRLD